MQKLRYNKTDNYKSPGLIPGKEREKSGLTAEIAKGFILFLHGMRQSAHLLRPEAGVGSSSLKNDEANENRLKQALNENIATNAPEDADLEADIEEEMISKWQAGVEEVKKAHQVYTVARPKAKSRIFSQHSFLRKETIKLLPVGNIIKMPLFPQRKMLPLPVKLATAGLVALIFSIFFNLSAPGLAGKIVKTTDAVYDFPQRQWHSLVNLPEYAINLDFFDGAGKIIVTDSKLKSRYIIKNQDKLSADVSKGAVFVITKDELLGLPASASEIAETEKRGVNWQEKIDNLILGWSSRAEKLYGRASVIFGNK